MKVIFISLFIFYSTSLFSQDFKHWGPSDASGAKDMEFGRNDKIFLSAQSGLYTSENMGVTWEKVKEDFNNIYFHPQITKNKKEDIYLYDHDSGIHSTKDNGQTWEFQIAIKESDERNNALGVYGDTVFIGSNKGLKYIYGSDFIHFNPKIVEEFVNKEVTALYVNNKKVVVGTKEYGIYISDDLGITWTHRSEGLPTQFEVNSIVFSGNRLIIGSTMSGIFYSNDWGISWSERNSGLNNLQINDMFVDGDVIYAATNGFSSSYISTVDELEWTSIDNHLPANYLTYSILARDNLILISNIENLYKSTDGGENWNTAIEGIWDGAFSQLHVFDNGDIIATSPNTGVFRKKNTDLQFEPLLKINGGYIKTASVKESKIPIIDYPSIKFWDNETNEIVEEISIEGLIMPFIFIDTKNKNFLSTPYDGIYYRTTDDNWEQFNSGLTSLEINDFKSSDDYIFAATKDGLYKSEIENDSWEKIEITNGELEIRNFMVHDDFIIASTYNAEAHTFYTYISHDKGKNWELCKDIEYISSFLYHDQILYAATYHRIYVSKDMGKTWDSFTVPNTFVESLIIYENELFMGTIEKGIISTPVNVSQTIEFVEIPELSYKGEDIVLQATSSSGLPITYTNSNDDVVNLIDNKVKIIAPGTTTITAHQEGNIYYKSVTTSKMLTINKASQEISFDLLEPVDENKQTITLEATASSGLPVIYTVEDPLIASIENNLVTIHKGGSTSIIASQPGNEFYHPAAVVKRDLIIAVVASSSSYDPTKNWLITPNPGNGRYNVILTENQGGFPDDFKVLNIHGKAVDFSIAFDAEKKLILDITGSPEGLYFLMVNDDKKSYVKRIIKSN